VTILFLRIASIVALLEVLGHTFLFVSFVPKHGPEEAAVVAAMQLHRFSFGGFIHSYWEMYFGYGLFVSIACLVEAGLLWQLAGMARNVSIRPMVALLAAGEAGYTVLMMKYFFIVPIAGHALMAICLTLAFLTAAGKSNESPAMQYNT
jgi:hypothetical protein